MTRKRTNPEFINGVPELLLLRLLKNKPMYGYELVQAIRLATDSRLEFGEGCIYPLLHKLEAEKILQSRSKKANGRSRIVYTVTKKGQKKLSQSMNRWNDVKEAIELVLQGGQNEQISFT